LALLQGLGGCVAAAALAVPAMTAIGAATRDKPTAEPPAQAATPPSSDAEGRLAGVTSIERLPLTELPAPTGRRPPAGESDTWRDFLAFALSRTSDATADGEIASAMLSQDGKLDLLPQVEPCERDDIAVVIDLDPGDAAFEPGEKLQPRPALASGLAGLREAG